MKPKRPAKNKALQPVSRRFDSLLRELRSFITESRNSIVRAVDVDRKSVTAHGWR